MAIGGIAGSGGGYSGCPKLGKKVILEKNYASKIRRSERLEEVKKSSPAYEEAVKQKLYA